MFIDGIIINVFLSLKSNARAIYPILFIMSIEQQQ